MIDTGVTPKHKKYKLPAGLYRSGEYRTYVMSDLSVEFFAKDDEEAKAIADLIKNSMKNTHQALEKLAKGSFDKLGFNTLVEMPDVPEPRKVE